MKNPEQHASDNPAFGNMQKTTTGVPVYAQTRVMIQKASKQESKAGFNSGNISNTIHYIR